ncbi:MAG: Ribosomal protein L11 methyltransferase [Spirochaetes bacterium ADurb.BinA120]|jgi:ribosomal protein L11 methylase PrmA|nr:MAG: Ribosomal protein L11 methyltransferase [Spirochaetes bacterium ADurb.BinA120]
MDDPAGSADSFAVVDGYESIYDLGGADILHCSEGFYGLEDFERHLLSALDPFEGIASDIWRCHAADMDTIELRGGLYVQPLASPSMGPPPAPSVIYIDPFSAFGDGRHPSTALCLRFLADYMGALSDETRRDLSVLDAGAGTGILSIAAEKLGADLIDAVELGSSAVESARRNIRLNECKKIGLRQGDLLTIDFSRKYDIVLANLVSDVIISCLEVLVPLVRPGGVMIASGIGTTRAAEVEERFFSAGVRIVDSALLDGWMAYLLEGEGGRAFRP